MADLNLTHLIKTT